MEPKLNDNSLKQQFRVSWRHWVIFTVIFTEVIGYSMVFPLLPYLGLELGLNQVGIGLVGSVFSLCQLFASPIIGKLSDRYGRKPLLIFSQLSTLAGFILLGFANTIFILVLARVADGLFGANMTVSQAALADLTPPEHRTSIYGYSSGVFGAGLIIGPMVGGILSQINFAVPMFFAAGITLLSIIFVILFIPETNITKAQHLKVKFSDVIPIKEIGKYSKDPRTGGNLLMFFVYNISFMLFINNFTLFVENLYGVGPDMASYYRMWIGILRVILQFIFVKRIIRKFGETNTLKSGVIALVITMAGMIISYSYYLVFIPLIFLSYGTGVGRPILTSKLTKSVKRSETATILGINNALNSFAQILSPIIGGIILLYGRPEILPFISGIGFTINYLIIRKQFQKKNHVNTAIKLKT